MYLHAYQIYWAKATLFYFDYIIVRTNALGHLVCLKRKYIQLDIEIYFSFNNMPQTV